LKIDLRLFSIVVTLPLVWACDAKEIELPGRSSSSLRGLYGAFTQGKYDDTGHPLNARVFQAETECERDVGSSQQEGWGAHPDRHQAGVLCRASAGALGGGRFRVNVRALTHRLAKSYCVQDAGVCAQMTALTVTVREGKNKVAEREIKHAFFEKELTYQNVVLSFSHRGLAPLTVEVSWPGERPIRIDYLEIFRAQRQLSIAPPSGVLDEDAELQIELVDPAVGAALEITCGDVDLTEQLTKLLDDKDAKILETENRRLISVPAKALLAPCTLPTRLRVRHRNGSYTRAVARVTYYQAPTTCDFTTKKNRILLTGFEPFPASSSADNSSEHAVVGYDARKLSNASVMRMILPVEWDTAAALVSSTIERCEPDVVVGFGQGGSKVDVETIAYNRKDSFEIAGGAEDNRGVTFAGQPIVDDGPESYPTRLPAQRIVDSLNAAEISATVSDDAGRYICNNVFYGLMNAVASDGRRAGFVHLPRIPSVGKEQREMLQTVVHTVLRETLARRQQSNAR